MELLRKYPNLYADLSALSGANAILRDPEYGVKFLDEFQDRLSRRHRKDHRQVRVSGHGQRTGVVRTLGYQKVMG